MAHEMISSLLDRRVLVTGAHGFIGKHVTKALTKAGYLHLVMPTHADYDLSDQNAVRALFSDVRPDVVIHLAGLVGGILANKQRPAEFFYDNIMMGTMVLHEAWVYGVSKYLTCIGGCSYPATAPSPIQENSLWNGYPQQESAAYALAKAMSVEQAQAYRRQHGFNAVVLVPGNVYGPHDNFDLNNSHVIPALIRKYYEAKLEGKSEVVIWGSGRPIRDFVYVEDVAAAIVRALEHYDSDDIVNISSGTGTSIRELAAMISELLGYKGSVVWDWTKPDGQLDKTFDVTRMKTLFGFECTTSLRDGLNRTIQWFAKHYGTNEIRL